MGNGWQPNNRIITRDCMFMLTTNSLFEFITCCKLSQSNKNLFFLFVLRIHAGNTVPAEIS